MRRLAIIPILLCLLVGCSKQDAKEPAPVVTEANAAEKKPEKPSAATFSKKRETKKKARAN